LQLPECVEKREISLHDNPLAIALPRALLENEDAQPILDFYRTLWEGGGRALGEARLLVVGQPSVGKTSLVHRLLEDSYDPHPKSTLTVETHTLPLGEYTARIWDFGGQEFMHSTHPFFFSKRCVYLLVLNVRNTYDQNRVAYWLRTIRTFAPEAPILIAGNQADAAQHQLDLPKNRLQREFGVRSFVETSAAEGRGIEELRTALAEAVESLPHVRVLFANTHLEVKAALEAEKESRNIIPRQRYAEICADHDISDAEDQETLLLLMHDLGVVLDFRNEAGEPLSESGILNPNWVANAVYRIITNEGFRSHTPAGRLEKSMLRNILHDYAPPHRALIMTLLRKFELCYPESDSAWWFPNLMPQDEPAETGDWEDALHFEYEYPELPESIITRFIVRTHEWIDAGKVWRWGVILANSSNRALVRASVPEKKVEIRVAGQENTRVHFLAQIRGHFDSIHKTFTEGKEKAQFSIEAFLLPAKYPGLRISFDDLLTFERKGVAEIPQNWQGEVVMVNVSEMLNGYLPRSATKEPKEPSAKEIHYHEHKHVDLRDANGSIINLGDGNTITQRVSDSFNTPSNPALAPLLAELTEAVKALLPKLDEETAEEVQEDLEHLQEELQKEKPKRKWYSVSLEGLKAAAKNLGEIGGPVLKLAAEISKMLSLP